MRTWRAAATIAAAVLCAVPSQAQVPLSPTDVYVKMRAAVNALPLPPYVAFTEQDDSERTTGRLRERLRVVARTADGHSFVRVLQNAQGMDVTPPPRVIAGGTYPGTYVERVGEFPLADFGLRPRRAGRSALFEAPGTPEPAPAGTVLPTIGSVSTYNLSYRVTDLGDTAIDGVPVYHIGLTPVRDPGHNVLRAAWVDKATFLPKRYVVDRFVENNGLSFRYLTTVGTALIAGRLVNVSADGHFELHRFVVVNESGQGRWSICDVTFPADPPDWLFDADRYRDHSGEPLPDL